MILFHIHDRATKLPPSRRIEGGWTAVAVPVEDLHGAAAADMQHCLFDVDLTTLPKAVEIRTFLDAVPHGLRIFACRRGDHHSAIQAGALGATSLIDRPISEGQIRDLLPVIERDGGRDTPSSVISLMAIDRCFRALGDATAMESGQVETAADALMQDIGEMGIATWLRSIRDHHAGTYQHCLQVAGLATAFGQSLGFPAGSLNDLSVAALLHDIGKAKVGHHILDKPGRLAPSELATMRMHPVWGEEYLRVSSDIAGPIRSAVRSHHEFLDGSGYPDGLRGQQISDLTRLITISDIFAALTEVRAYKPALPAEEAMTVLRGMAADGKIEKALVAAFAPVARQLSAAA